MGKYDPLRRYLASKRQGAQARFTANWHIKSVGPGAERATLTRGAAVAPAPPPVLSAPVPTASAPPVPTVAASPANLAAESDQHTGETSRWSRAGEIGAGVIAAASAGASEIVGLAHLPGPVLLVLATAVGVIAWTLAQAVQGRKAADRGYWWWAGSTGLLVLLTAGAFTYHKEFDPATRPHRTYELVVNGGQDDVIPLYGEAGGPPQSLTTGVADQKALIGGQGYAFDCWTLAPDGSQWLRYERYHQSWWAPRKYLHPPFGERAPSLPHC